MCLSHKRHVLVGSSIPGVRGYRTPGHDHCNRRHLGAILILNGPPRQSAYSPGSGPIVELLCSYYNPFATVDLH